MSATAKASPLLARLLGYDDPALLSSWERLLFRPAGEGINDVVRWAVAHGRRPVLLREDDGPAEGVWAWISALKSEWPRLPFFLPRRLMSRLPLSFCGGMSRLVWCAKTRAECWYGLLTAFRQATADGYRPPF